MNLVECLATLGRLERQRALVKAASISDAAKAKLLEQLRQQEAEIERQLDSKPPAKG